MKNKFAIVTGASRGIGLGVAQYLAEQGYDLGLIARNKEWLEAVADTMRKKYSHLSIDAVAVDLGNIDQAYQAVQTLIATADRIDVLFNNAGVLVPGADELPSESFHQMLQVNVEGLFAVIKAVLEKMTKQGTGYVFNLSSMSGIRAFPETALYAATKFAVTGLTEGLYKKYKSEGINITAICPSVVNTEMTQRFDMPLEDKIQVEDIVKTVDYLMSLSSSAVMPKIEIHCRAIG